MTDVAAPTRASRASLVETALARLRVATPTDNARVLELMADVPMEGGLALATQRDPDFFALYDMQRGDNRLWVYDGVDGGPITGMGGVLVRDGFLDGAPQKVGYLGDLRTQGLLRERLAFPQVYAHLFQRTVDETGCQAFLTGILADNAKALRALTSSSSSSSSSSSKASSKKKRQAQPHYGLLARFDMCNVHFLGKKRRAPPSGLTVTTASMADLPAITARLAEDHRARPFGWRFDDGEFEHRLARWPGFTLDNTLVVKDAAGAVTGVATCYDAAAVKRYRVLRYAGQMVWVKRGLSLAARVLGSAPLPDVGADFRYFYLANLSIKDDHPAVMQAIVDAAYQRFQDRGFHFMAFPLYEGDPLAAGVRGHIVRKMPFHLYAVTSSTNPRSAWPAGRPGFEMALA